MVAAVPAANMTAFREHAEAAAAVFRQHGALAVIECWGDDDADLCLFLASPLACNTPARASCSTGASFSRESLLCERVS